MSTFAKNIKVRSLYRIFMILIAVVLFLPMFQQMFHIFRYKAIDENRTRAPFPRYISMKKIPSFFESFNLYAMDNFGLRDVLIRFKNQVDFSVFHFSEKVYFGSDGYLFNREFEDHDRPKILAATPQQWDDVLQRMNYLHVYLAKKNIQLLYVPIPLVDSIYPEKFSQLKHVGFDARLYQRFYSDFDAHNIDYLDVMRVFQSHKTEQLYYKTDFHYTAIGAFYTMKAMLNKLYEMTGSSHTWDYSLAYRSQPFTDGVLNKYLAVFQHFDDTQYGMKRYWKDCAVPFDQGWRSTCPEQSTLPPAVLFANSFMAIPLVSGFSDEFPVLYVNLLAGNKDIIREKITHLPKETKIVIIEFYEADMWNFLYQGTFPEVGSLDYR